MAEAAVLKNWKTACLRNSSTDRYEILLGDAYWPSKPDRQLKFQTFKSKMADGRRLKLKVVNA